MKQINRKRFLRGAALAFLGGGAIRSAVSGEIKAQTGNGAALPTGLATIPGGNDQNHIVRMMNELRRSLAKRRKDRQWGMVIDLRKCVGCKACTINCAVENGLPPGVVYRPVIDEEIGVYPNVNRKFIPRPCMQCAEPPCVPVCPVTATYAREDGVVEIDYDQCIGCRYCLTACPYSARTSDFGDFFTKGVGIAREREKYEEREVWEYGVARRRADHGSPVGNARKCHFCVDKVEQGILPSCVTTCIGHATYFGDLRDPKSLVSKLSARSNSSVLKEELGTKPSVRYLT